MFGWIHSDDNTTYEEEVQRLTSRCSEHYLQFNIRKTKDIVIDFRRNRNPPSLTVNCETVERVTTYKYLGVIIDDTLNWN